MKKRTFHCAILLIVALLVVPVRAQGPIAQSKSDTNKEAIASRFEFKTLLAQSRTFRPKGLSLMGQGRRRNPQGDDITAQAGPPVVQGSGTIGRITKFVSFNGTNYIIGNSVITESLAGNIGIGMDPTDARVSVNGVVSATGGFRFGDGSVQTTAGLATVAHDATLTGNGTAASPLGVAIPLSLSAPAVSSFTVLQVAAGTNNSGTGGSGINAAGGFGMIGGDGVRAFGAFGSNTGGIGVSGVGGPSTNGDGGVGVKAFGGGTGSGNAGNGITSVGGSSSSGFGGIGIDATGGDSDTNAPGIGVAAFGGNVNTNGFGGVALYGEGGIGLGAGKSGGYGLFAIAGLGGDGADEGLAGYFEGDVEIAFGGLTIDGNLKAMGTKMFHIDHPLDPENKYLNHAAIESSEVLNVYSGNVMTDENGYAVVRLPEWFEALNKDFRYQLTVIGTFAQAIVADEIKANRFSIRTSAGGVKVSWQVTGVRNDRGMRKLGFKVEEDKPERERGHYLQPEAFDQPKEKSIQWARNPEMIEQLKQRRIEAELRIKKQESNRR